MAQQLDVGRNTYTYFINIYDVILKHFQICNEIQRKIIISDSYAALQQLYFYLQKMKVKYTEVCNMCYFNSEYLQPLPFEHRHRLTHFTEILFYLWFT
jgi:hypothetical protein